MPTAPRSAHLSFQSTCIRFIGATAVTEQRGLNFETLRQAMPVPLTG